MFIYERINPTTKLLNWSETFSRCPSRIVLDRTPEQGEIRDLCGATEKHFQIPNLYPSLQQICFHFPLFLT